MHNLNGEIEQMDGGTCVGGDGKKTKVGNFGEP